MNPPPHHLDDEYEYEYDNNETEVGSFERVKNPSS